MKTRGLDSNDDWDFGRGKQSYVSDKDAVSQNIKTRLRSWKGDCFFDVDSGVDWTNFLDKGKKTQLDLDIKRVILQTAGVLRIKDFSGTLDSSERNLTIAATVDSIFGSITLQEAL